MVRFFFTEPRVSEHDDVEPVDVEPVEAVDVEPVVDERRVERAVVMLHVDLVRC